jgi:hypothetical protein
MNERSIMVARSERYYKNGASFESFVGPGKGTKDLFFLFFFVFIDSLSGGLVERISWEITVLESPII